MNMKLLYQTHSPYARKVLVAAYEMGLHEKLSVIHHETSPTRRNEAVFASNPLGKVPVLICDDGTVLFDSNVICEYLDGLHEGPAFLPSPPQLRFRALKMQALAQGIADAGITARWESERRPAELRWPAMRDGQVEKIATACDFLEQELNHRSLERLAVDRGGAGAGGSGEAGSRGSAETVSGGSGGAGSRGSAGAAVAVSGGSGGAGALGLGRPDIGDIALVTALSWVEFRRVYDFLRGRPRLTAWYEALCARPSMRATRLEGQTHD